MSPSKRAFEKYKPLGVFAEFYGMAHTVTKMAAHNGKRSILKILP